MNTITIYEAIQLFNTLFIYTIRNGGLEKQAREKQASRPAYIIHKGEGGWAKREIFFMNFLSLKAKLGLKLLAELFGTIIYLVPISNHRAKTCCKLKM